MNSIRVPNSITKGTQFAQFSYNMSWYMNS